MSVLAQPWSQHDRRRRGGRASALSQPSTSHAQAEGELSQGPSQHACHQSSDVSGVYKVHISYLLTDSVDDVVILQFSKSHLAASPRA